jgi:hypothetical protein
MTDYEAFAYNKPIKGRPPRQRSWTIDLNRYDSLNEIIVRNAQARSGSLDARFTPRSPNGEE